MMLFLAIHCKAARLLETPRGIVLCALYWKGIGLDRCRKGIPVIVEVIRMWSSLQ